MNRRSYGPSSALNRSRNRIKSDNICLIPASQLPFKEEWTRIAQGLPAREVVLVLPEGGTPLKQAVRAILPQLRAKGRHITAIGALKC